MSLKLSIRDLGEDEKDIDASVDPADITISSPDLISLDPPNLHIHACIVSETLIVRGDLSANFNLLCCRCLCNVRVGYSGEFFYEEALKDQDIIDLTPAIEEDIITALPIKTLCHKDCKGLCPKCGQNLNESQCQCNGGGNRWTSSPFDNLNL